MLKYRKLLQQNDYSEGRRGVQNASLILKVHSACALRGRSVNDYKELETRMRIEPRKLPRRGRTADSA